MAFPIPFSRAVLVTLALLAGLPAQGATDAPAEVLPGDDFFRYANASWLATAAIPPGKASWGARTEIAERTQTQVLQLLDEARAAPPGTRACQVADYRAALMDEAAIEARGMRPLGPMLRRIEALRSKNDLARFLGSGLRADVDPIHFGVYDSSHVLGLAVQAGNHGEKDYVAYLLQGGLGMPRENYLGADARMQAARVRRQEDIARALARLGSQPERAAAVMALETALARSHSAAEASDNESNADTLWTRADFARNAPGLDWPSFFAAAGLSKQPAFVAWQPGAVTGLAALVRSQPLQVWQDYLRVHLVARYSDVLPAAQREAPQARAQRALAITQRSMRDSIGRMYAERYFPPEQKRRVQSIVANVIAEFTRRVEAAQWMSADARSKAVTKLKSIYFGVAYPERWPDARIAVDARDALGNQQRVERRDYAMALARLGHRVDREEWQIAPQFSGATLLFVQNAYNFSAALLQPPKFDPSASDAANYGAIGAIAGHEASHFVDTLGADYEADGARKRWWSDADMESYKAVSAPLARQFSAYRALPDTAVNGELGLTENVADLGGLVAAFEAYRRTLPAGTSKEDMRRQDREFFIGFAQAWRIKYTDEALRKQAASDHSPEEFRVSTVRNLDAWYEAFDVKPGQRLYLEPAARVRVW